VYFQIEILDDASIYERVFPHSLGYPEFSQARPAEYRQGDKLPYVEIKVGDHLKLRKIARPSWADDFLPEK